MAVHPVLFSISKLDCGAMIFEREDHIRRGVNFRRLPIQKVRPVDPFAHRVDCGLPKDIWAANHVHIGYMTVSRYDDCKDY